MSSLRDQPERGQKTVGGPVVPVQGEPEPLNLPPDDIGRCRVDLGIGTLCGRLVVDVFAVGCVHEHIHQYPLCQWCAHALANGGLACSDCQDCADPHECILHLIPTVVSR